MRKLPLVLIVILVAVIAGGSWFAHRLWQAQKVRAIALGGATSTPDFSRWSPEFVARVRAARTAIASGPEPVAALAELARLYLANGLSAEAEPALRALRELDPQNARWAYYSADLRLKANDQAGARALLADTVRLAPDYGPALALLGDMLVREKRFAEARPYLESGVNLGLKDPRPAVGLAFIEGSTGRQTDAIQRLREVARAFPRYGPAHGMLAELLAAAHDPQGAAQHRERARLADATFASVDPWINELGEACYDAYRLELLAAGHMRIGDYGATLPFLERAVKLSPGEATFYDLLAEMQEAVGKLEDARGTLVRGVENVPDSHTLVVRLAVVLCRLSRAPEAVTLLDGALTRWSERAEVQAARGHALHIAGRPTEAIQAFRAALARNDRLPEAHYTLGKVLLEQEQLDEAQRSLEKALTLRPDYPEVLNALAGLAIRRGDAATAERLGQTLIGLQPRNAEARRLWAGVHLLKGNLAAQAGRMDEAGELFRRGVEVDPSLGLLHGSLGMIEAGRQRFEAAVPHFQRYAAAAPDDVNAYRMLHRACVAAGRPADADELIKQGLARAQNAGDARLAGELTGLLSGRD